MMVSLSFVSFQQKLVGFKKSSLKKLNYIFFVDSVIYYFILIGVTVNKHFSHNLL